MEEPEVLDDDVEDTEQGEEVEEAGDDVLDAGDDEEQGLNPVEKAGLADVIEQVEDMGEGRTDLVSAAARRLK